MNHLLTILVVSAMGQPNIPAPMPLPFVPVPIFEFKAQPDLISAAVLLTEPQPGVAWEPSEREWPGVQAGIHKVSVDWEILDQREARYVMSRREDFISDLKMLRNRYQRLHDAPRLVESNLLPKRSLVNDMVRFNRAYNKHLNMRLEFELDRQAELEVVIRETQQAYVVWDKVRDATCEFYYVAVRREAMKSLIELIGEEAFYSQEFPPIVPIWRFNELKQ